MVSIARSPAITSEDSVAVFLFIPQIFCVIIKKKEKPKKRKEREPTKSGVQEAFYKLLGGREFCRRYQRFLEAIVKRCQKCRGDCE